MTLPYDPDVIIRSSIKRFYDEKRYCEKCEHAGRVFFVDDKGFINHRYCDCFFKQQNLENYPTLLKRSRIPKMAIEGSLEEFTNCGTTTEQKRENAKTIEEAIRITENIRECVARGDNLYVQGSSGTGKTLLACLIGKAAMLEGIPVAYCQFNNIASAILSGLSDDEVDFRDYMRWAKVLIVDDIDKMKTQNNIQEGIFDQLIRARVHDRLTCIYTAVSPSRKIHEKLGFQNQSIIKERCTNLTLLGEDSRVKSS